MIDRDVLSICTAYEQGVGKGRDGRKKDNPYKEGSDENEAWGYGYCEGTIWLDNKIKNNT